MKRWYILKRTGVKRWCIPKVRLCEYAQINGYCSITACIKAGEQE